MSHEDASNYSKLSDALRMHFNLTEEGYRNKFRYCKPRIDETPEQFAFRLKTYLTRWIELSPTE